MKKYFLILFLSFFSFKTFAAENIIDEMQRRKDVIYEKMAATKDPEQRRQLIEKLSQINELYNDKEIRIEAIRKVNPTWAKALDAAKDKDPGSTEQQQVKSGWEGLADKDKVMICSQVLAECKKSVLEYCRFTVTKCRQYLPENEYNAILNRFQSRY